MRNTSVSPRKHGAACASTKTNSAPDIRWSPFAADTDYFGAGPQPYMINFRVDDLDGLLEQLRADGVAVDERIDQSEFGRFGWITDPEGTRIELWQPPA